jgi:hypothetical protein
MGTWDGGENVTPLLDTAYSSTKPVNVGASTAVVSQAVSLGETPSGTRIALIGNGLEGLQPVYPTDAHVESHNGTGAIVTVPTNELTGLKQIVLRDQSDTLVLATVPSPPDGGPTHSATLIQVTSGGVVRITGKGLTALQSVTYNGKPVKILSKKVDSLTLQLSTEALARVGTPQLKFVFSKESKVNYSLNFFSQRLEVEGNTGPK